MENNDKTRLMKAFIRLVNECIYTLKMPTEAANKVIEYVMKTIEEKKDVRH